MAGQFDGKVVMITGAGGALASGVIEKFAKEGAKLVLLDYSEDNIKSAVERHQDILGEYLMAVADLSKPEQMADSLKKAVDKFGQIDVLVHTAGGFAMGDPVHESDISLFEKMMTLNARLTFIVLGQVAKHMVDNGIEGSITSIIARPASSGEKNKAAYSASKAAALRIVESMALELKDHKIRVNGISPSVVDTPANRKDMPDADFDKWVKPIQIANMIAYLASDVGKPISGQNIGVYGRA